VKVSAAIAEVARAAAIAVEARTVLNVIFISFQFYKNGYPLRLFNQPGCKTQSTKMPSGNFFNKCDKKNTLVQELKANSLGVKYLH
jgi:uncharacterized membrane protein